MTISSFSAAEAYLRSTINERLSRRHPNRLDRMRALLERLGNPHLGYPTVHVGGTSGKGSTSTMIAAAISAGGRRCGLHTKPHLTTVRERARVDGVPVSEEMFVEILDEMQPALEEVTHEHGRPTYYETLLALAFVAFAQAEVDCAVIEVGIGGKLDGTNLIEPEVSAITNVGLDHTDVLGNTIEEIAADKAGIAKPGVPLVTDARDSAALSVIRARCAEVGAPLIVVGDNAAVAQRPSVRYGQAFTVRTERTTYDLALPVLGKFQQRNAATAILVLERLPATLAPERAAIENGLASLVLPGRMEFFPSHPGVVFDIAHNGDKARNLADALQETFAGRHFTFVLAIAESKDVRAILAPLAALPASFVFTSFEAEGRASLRPQRLASEALEAGVWGRTLGDPVDAFNAARRSDANELVVVTGSTFLVAQLREWWFANVASPSSS